MNNQVSEDDPQYLYLRYSITNASVLNPDTVVPALSIWIAFVVYSVHLPAPHVAIDRMHKSCYRKNLFFHHRWHRFLPQTHSSITTSVSCCCRLGVWHQPLHRNFDVISFPRGQRPPCIPIFMFTPTNTVQLRRLVVDLRPAAGFDKSTGGHVDADHAVVYRFLHGKAEIVVWVAVMKYAFRQGVEQLQDSSFTNVLLEEEGRIGVGRKADKVVLYRRERFVCGD